MNAIEVVNSSPEVVITFRLIKCFLIFGTIHFISDTLFSVWLVFFDKFDKGGK